MAFLQVKLVFTSLLVLCLSILVSAHDRRYTTPNVTRLTDLFPHVSISNSFSKAFGAPNIQLIGNGAMATIALDKSSGEVLCRDDSNHIDHYCFHFLYLYIYKVLSILVSCRVWISLKKQILLWILQCLNQAPIWSLTWGRSGFLCELYYYRLTVLSNACIFKQKWLCKFMHVT